MRKTALPGTLLLIAPGTAMGEFRLNTQHIERDLTLIIFAIATLTIFYIVRHASGLRVRPLGRRSTDLQKLELTRPEFTTDSITPKLNPRMMWETVSIESHATNPPQGAQFWRVSLFSASQWQQDPCFEEAFAGYFSFAMTPSEADRVITPIMRKIYARYKHQFEVSSPITILYSDCQEETLTWLPSEAALRATIFRFLDECLTVSNLYHMEPTLTISRGTIFWIAVTWNETLDIGFARRIIEANRDAVLVEEDDSVGLRLNFSLPRSAILQRRMDTERRSA
jgi:hypothetical protein